MEFEYPEGATPLSPQEKEGLIHQHITKQVELDELEQNNLQSALGWLSSRKSKGDILTEEFICELHRQMFGKVWKWTGEFRSTEKNIGVDWTRIRMDLKILLEDTKYWIENNSYSEDEIAYRFHHRLVQIHPFANGNGRHSRFMTDLLLERVLKKKIFTWGAGANLVKNGDERKRHF